MARIMYLNIDVVLHDSGLNHILEGYWKNYIYLKNHIMYV